MKYICKNSECQRSFIGKSIYQNYKYCSHACAGHVCGKKSAKTHRMNGTGFYSSDFQREMNARGNAKGGRVVQAILKKKHLGLYGLTRQQRIENGRKSGRISQRVMKVRGIGFYGLSFKQHSDMGKLNGVKSIKILRKKYLYKHPKYLGVIFDSESEVLLCKMLMKRYSSFKPIQNVTVHRKVGCKEFDFLVRNTFFDFHSFDVNKSLSQYYKERREILNDNGYDNACYIVLSRLKKFDNITLRKEGVI
jgi:hypothetical protein